MRPAPISVQEKLYRDVQQLQLTRRLLQKVYKSTAENDRRRSRALEHVVSGLSQDVVYPRYLAVSLGINRRHKTNSSGSKVLCESPGFFFPIREHLYFKVLCERPVVSCRINICILKLYAKTSLFSVHKRLYFKILCESLVVSYS